MNIDYDRYAESIDEWFENLDTAVIEALQLFIDKGLPNLDLGDYEKPLGIGSGNAFQTIKILLQDKDSFLASESTYQDQLDLRRGDIDGVVLLSASGEKSAPGIARSVKERGLEIKLLTCNPNALSINIVGNSNSFVFPKRPEPYTYNTSTYLGMILGKTKENPKEILDYLTQVTDPLLERRDLTRENFSAYCFIVPGEFDFLKEMLRTKFIELFSDRFPRDFFSPEFAEKHAIDVVQRNPKTLYVSLGYDNTSVGDESQRLNIPLPDNVDYGTAMAVGYYFVGKIQRANPPWFKESLIEWSRKKNIQPLVE